MDEKKKRAEIVKETSRGLRGTIATELGEGSRPFTSGNAQLLKFHGTYQQDDRDLRARLRAEGKDRKYFFMIRTKNPGGGELSPEQWEILNRVSERCANGTLRITTREDIQFHGVGKENLKAAIALLNSELISTYGACGDGNRNTMACPVANTRKGSVFDGQAVAREITKLLDFKSQAYYEIWLDGEKITADETETIYGSAYLPRKFKIGIAYPDDNCIDVYTHDIGIVPVLDRERVAGFTVLVGGGMGSTHGKKETFPRLGEPLGFIPTDRLLEVVTRIVEFQRDHGNRGDRSRARLKYVVEDRGIERVRAEIEARLGWKVAAERPVCFPPGELHLGWHEQNEPGRWYVGIFVENGRIKDTEGCSMLAGLREIVRGFRPAVRLTPSQDLILSGIPEEKVELVRGALREYRIPTEKQVSSLRRHALACPALPTCGLAITEAERRLPFLIDALEGLGYGNEEIRIRMSGCPNSCSRPPTAEIGLIGRFKDKYNIYVGGSPQGTRLAQLYAEAVETPDLMRELARLIDVYRVHRQPQEHFGDFCRRIGVARLHELAESQDGDREEILRNLSWSPTDEELEQTSHPESGRFPSESGSVMRKFLRTILLTDLLQGLWVTFRNQHPKNIYTEQYPAERPKVAERYRGAPRLNINPDTTETLCISCNLCALACPENLIVVTSVRNEQTRRKDLTTFTYDLSRCMFCGLCEDACPVDALELTQDFELASYTREGGIWDRQMLEEGPRPTQYKY